MTLTGERFIQNEGLYHLSLNYSLEIRGALSFRVHVGTAFICTTTLTDVVSAAMDLSDKKKRTWYNESCVLHDRAQF